jgi:L-lactate dehydrogenase (cytochrome)
VNGGRDKGVTEGKSDVSPSQDGYRRPEGANIFRAAIFGTAEMSVAGNAAGNSVPAGQSTSTMRRSTKSVPRHLRTILSLDDFEKLARRRLPRPIFSYISSGVEDENCLAESRATYQDYVLVPRYLTDVSGRNQETTLFGKVYSAPFGIAPMGICAMSAYRGDIALAEASREASIPMVISGSSLIRLEEIAAANPAAWFQSYLPPTMAQIELLLDRVIKSGIETLVVTVDTGVGSNRENNLRNGFSTPLRPNLDLAWQGITHPRWTVQTLLRTLVNRGMPHFENSYATRGVPVIARSIEREFSGRAHLTWEHMKEIRRYWPGKFVIKGLLDVGDARLARDIGADGIVVSNHGGRQLDASISSLRALPPITDAITDIPVMFDGGVRRGTDVLKAIGLGASFVFAGRPFNYALAVDGRGGVSHAISILKEEVLRGMGQIGINSLNEMTRERIVNRQGV